MIKFSGALSIPWLDAGKYQRALDRVLTEQLQEAAREWLRAVVVAVPVYTGTARGTLRPLGRFLRVAVSISPVASRPGRGPSVGESQQTFTLVHVGSQFIFEWDTELLHYKINEYYDVSSAIHLKNPVPWHSIEKGNVAFKRYVDDVLPTKYPELSDYITTKTVRI